MMERLKKVATGLDLPFGDRRMTYNSRLAQELSKWAETKGYGDQFHRIIFHLYFAEGLNIANPNLLVRSAGSIGLSEEEAQEILNARSFKEAVDADWRLSRSLGITAVPTFVVKESILVGAQPYETLEKFLLREGGMRQAETRE